MLVASLFIMWIFYPLGSNAKSNATISIDSTWTLDVTVNNVDCYYKIVDCDGVKKVFLMFNNRNQGAVDITWIDKVSTQHEDGLESFVGEKKLNLSPGESASYNCSSSSNVVVTSTEVNPTYIAVIKAYNIKVISVQ